MSQLEALQPNAAVRGILPDALVTVVSVQWFGSEALELTYKNPAGRVANELLYRHDEARLDVVEQGVRGALTATDTSSGSCLKRIASVWRIYSTQCSPCIRPSSTRSRTRL